MLNRKSYWPKNPKKGRGSSTKNMRQARGNDDIFSYMSNSRRTGLVLTALRLRKFYLALIGLLIILSFAPQETGVSLPIAFAILAGVTLVILVGVWIFWTFGGIIAYFLSKIF